jgi:hypothetical protein
VGVLNEPIARLPFVMNTEQNHQAFEDYRQAGLTIPE